MKLLFFDLETTGLDPHINGIHQLSGKIVIGDDEKEAFNFTVQPHSRAIFDQAALDVAGVTEEQIASYAPMTRVFSAFIGLLNRYVNQFDSRDKFHLVGYNNASFDNNFLRAWFQHNNHKYFGSYFWSDSIDVMCLASNHLRGIRNNMVNFKLKTVAEQMGLKIDADKLHDALYDIELTHCIYNAIVLDTQKQPA